MDEFFARDYVQHNPLAATGAKGLKDFLDWARTRAPNAEHRVKRMFVDGDYVIAHVHVVINPGEVGNAVIDIFRIANGRIAEHWDVAQEGPRQGQGRQHQRDVLGYEPGEAGGARLVGRREDQQAQVRGGLDGVGRMLERHLAQVRIRQGVDALRRARDLGAAPVSLEVGNGGAQLLDEPVECRVIGRLAVVEARLRQHAPRDLLVLVGIALEVGLRQQDLQQVALAGRACPRNPESSAARSYSTRPHPNVACG